MQILLVLFWWAWSVVLSHKVCTQGDTSCVLGYFCGMWYNVSISLQILFVVYYDTVLV